MTTAKRHSNPFVGDGAVHTSPLKAAINYLLVCLLVIALFWVSLAMLGYTFDFSFVNQYQARIVQGFLLTIEISAASLVASLALGTLVAAGRGSRILPLRYLCDLYVKLIRGTPLIMQIYQMANGRSAERLETKGDDDFSFSLKGVSRFRVSAYKQRGSLAAVIRVVAPHTP